MFICNFVSWNVYVYYLTDLKEQFPEKLVSHTLI
jgi:hypothetical protein